MPTTPENELAKLLQKQKEAEQFLKNLKAKSRLEEENTEPEDQKLDDLNDIDPNKFIGCGG